MSKTDVSQAVKAYEKQIIEYRRHLHRHPELSFKEEKTAAWIREKLKELDIPTLPGVRGNSTVGILKGEEEGPTLLFRADIDALPITEESGVPFASENPGVMHACGHDAHTATLLCFADWLSHHRELIRGTVKFVFQQGEDCTPGGGRFIVEDGVLDDIDYGFAWHCAPELELGNVSVTPGPSTASFCNWRMHIKGVGGHAGFPFNAVDPISAGAMVVSALNQLPMWNVPPLESVTMIVSRFDSGLEEAFNVVPETAVIEGNLRSLNNELADKMIAKVQETGEKICAAKGCECIFEKIEGYPAVINDQEITEFLYQELKKQGVGAVKTKPIMGAEDFGFYARTKPCTYFKVGVHNPDRPETGYMPHNPHFCIDEKGMLIALETLMRIYLSVAGR